MRERSTAEIEQLRMRALEACARLETLAQGSPLAAVPGSLFANRAKLQRNQLRILVCGDSQRGKSTLVNALIGRELLPVGPCAGEPRAFRVESASEDAFRARFEDGSARAIAAHELQCLAADGGATLAEAARVLRWVECDVRSTLLPRGVSLLDTPGLHSLHAGQAQILGRFLPHADAVLVVLDALEPISASELELIERILHATRQIMFVQTRLELTDADAALRVRQEHERALQARFALRARVWPIASSWLMRAAQAGPDAGVYLRRSGHAELLAALRSQLADGIGRARARALVGEARGYALQAQALCASSCQVLQADARAATELERRVQRRLRAFEQAWHFPDGTRLRELLAQLRIGLRVIRDGFLAQLQEGGEIVQRLERELDALGSYEAARAWQARLDARVRSDVHQAFVRASARALTLCRERLGPFEKVLGAECACFKQPWTSGAWYADVVAMLGAPYEARSALLPPQLSAAKGELRRELRELIELSALQFFGPRFEFDGKSVSDRMFEALNGAIARELEGVIRGRERAARFELAELQALARLSREARPRALGSWQRAAEDWGALCAELEGLAVALA